MLLLQLETNMVGLKYTDTMWIEGLDFNLKNFIANLVLVQPVCGKKRNIFSKKGAGGVKGRSEIFRKFINFREGRLPYDRRIQGARMGLPAECRTLLIRKVYLFDQRITLGC